MKVTTHWLLDWTLILAIIVLFLAAIIFSIAAHASTLHGIACTVSTVQATHDRIKIRSPCAPFDRVFGAGFDTTAPASQAPAHYACTARVQAHSITAPDSGAYTCEVSP